MVETFKLPKLNKITFNSQSFILFMTQIGLGIAGFITAVTTVIGVYNDHTLATFLQSKDAIAVYAELSMTLQSVVGIFNAILDAPFFKNDDPPAQEDVKPPSA